MCCSYFNTMIFVNFPIEYDCEEGLKKFLDNSDHSIVGELAAPDLCVASEPKVK